MSVHELQKEVLESREKLKAITQKFTSVRKERDALKQESKEL
jgi:FtsZ-binding cell division protein ZapB